MNLEEKGDRFCIDTNSPVVIIGVRSQSALHICGICQFWDCYFTKNEPIQSVIERVPVVVVVVNLRI